jgi:hypothetical protein
MAEEVKELKEKALVHLGKELTDARLPAVLSSYMTTDNLPEAFRGIDGYVQDVRKQLIKEAGGRLTQLQMMVLDGICELTIVIKYISTFIAEQPASNIVAFDKFGIPHPTDMVIRGLSGLHQVLDKKIKQFHDMTADQKDEMSAAEMHRRAIMGEHKPTGRPTGGQKHNQREGVTGRFVKSAN